MAPTDRSPARLSRRGLMISGAAGVGVAASIPLAQAAPGRDGSGGGGDHRRRHPQGRTVQPGADAAAEDDWSVLGGDKIGVITNPTGILQQSLGSIVDAMAGSDAVDIVAVFGPEHGFRGTAQAGESEDTYVDERTGVTVYDAYGADADAFADLYQQSGVQTVVFDIQDVGARFYTYIWTMYEAMIAAARAGLRFVVLDRPNPIGGHAAGPLLTDGYTSGVGKDRIVQAHGMTVGEVARFFDGEFLPELAGNRLPELEVVQVRGWRGQLFADTGLPWVMPSPNMPTADTALLYAGTCLFEATNLSEGRGTTRPFELIGAPYVDYQWAEWLTGRDLAGVRFREAYFTPTFSKNEGEVCGGVQVHLTEPDQVDPIRVATEMIVGLRDLYPEFGWRGDGGRWIDLLTGSSRFRQQLTDGASADDIIGAWQPELADFDDRRRPYLLYRR